MLKSKLFAVTLTFRASALSHQLSHTLTPAFYLRQAFVGTIRPQSSITCPKLLLNFLQFQQLLHSQPVRAYGNLLYHQLSPSPSPSPSSICTYIPPSSRNYTARQYTGNRVRKISWSISFDVVSGQKNRFLTAVFQQKIDGELPSRVARA